MSGSGKTISGYPTLAAPTSNTEFLVINTANVNNTAVTNTYVLTFPSLQTQLNSTNAISLGTVSTGNVSLDPTLGRMQYMTVNGAITIVAPSVDGEIDLMITTGSAANTITYSGFTKQISGDAYSATANNKYLVEIKSIHSIKCYKISAMQ